MAKSRRNPPGDCHIRTSVVIMNMINSKKGITLIEVLIVIGCLTVLLGPAWFVFQKGSQSSLKSMLQNETILEGQRVLKQIANDIKNSCWQWQHDSPSYSLDDILISQNVFPNNTYSLLVFPTVGDIEEVISKTSPDKKRYRLVNKVSYYLEKNKKQLGYPVYSLIRKEEFNRANPISSNFPNNIRLQTISDKILHFSMRPEVHQTNSGCAHVIRISLQLVDSIRPVKTSQPSQGQSGPIVAGPNLVIADFFEVVHVPFLSEYSRLSGPTGNGEHVCSQFIRNPYTDIQAP